MTLFAGALRQLRSADPVATSRLLRAVDAALDAVDPYHLTRRKLDISPDGIRVGGDLIEAERVVVLAFGKSAGGMARAAADAIGERVRLGLVVSDKPEPVPSWAELVVGGHPLPDSGSLRAAQRAIQLVQQVEPDELLLVLVSGGGSALLEAPVAGLDLDDLAELNDQLIRSGAPISVINGVRRTVSRVKGGKLALLCHGRVVSLVISDVGSDPAVVASGPTIVAPGAPPPAADLLDRLAIKGRAADRVGRVLASPERESTADVGRRRDLALILADGTTAAEAAAKSLASEGLNLSPAEAGLAGDAAPAALHELAKTPEGQVRVIAGETTVVARGSGRGGRNQHAALAAGIAVAGSAHRFVAIGTDGIDGPTDAAGGCVDGASVADGEQARRRLETFDSYPYLKSVGALIRTGRTGCNVADLWIVDKSGHSMDHIKL